MPSLPRAQLTTIVLGAACLWLAFLAAGAGLRHTASERDLTILRDRVLASRRDNLRLSDDLERMRQPTWLALIVRDRLNYKQPGETVVFVYKSDKSDIVGQPQAAVDTRPNWRKWWDWLQER